MLTKPMAARTLERIVSDDPALAGLWNCTRPLRELQNIYATLVPPYLRAASRVGSVAREELKLFADSGAVATRLRLMAPELLLQFRAHGRQFNAIRVAVQVRTPPAAHQKQPREPLDAKAKQSLLRAAARIGDSPLKAALDRLAKTR